jgi:NTE family protein
MTPSGTEQDRRLELLIEVLGRLQGPEAAAQAERLLPWFDWYHVAGGEMLYRPGDVGDDLYLIVSGRLRVLPATAVQFPSADEVTRGQTVGESEFLTGQARAHTVVATRDSVLARLSRAAFEEIAHRDPQLALTLTRLLADRLRLRIESDKRPSRPVNLCLLAISDGIDVLHFAHDLARRLSFGHRVLVISHAMSHDHRVQANAEIELSSEHYRQFAQWLDEAECTHEILIFVADSSPGEWTRRCVNGSDEVVLLARADDSPALRPIEVSVGNHGAAARQPQTLVLLHDQNSAMPSATSAWLANRRLDQHVHVRPALDRDMARLARLLSGTAIGLVLSGGGARGLAHLGVLKALEEFGIQVDTVGGASIGAIAGAYCAFDLPAQMVIDLARNAFAAGPTSDLSLIPLMSLIRGRRLKKVIDEAVVASTGGLIDIEDTWKNLFCVVSNYTLAAEVVVTRGDLAKWLRTSVSIPGVLPPVPHSGELMGDGGTFNNFPTDVMREQGVGYLIGSDLLQAGFRPLEIDDLPNSWQLLRDRLRPRRKRRYRVPGLTSMLVSTTTLVSQSHQREARKRADLCFTPPMKGIGMLDWGKFDAIVETGYRHAKEILADLPETELARLRGTEPVGTDSADLAPTSWLDDFVVP